MHRKLLPLALMYAGDGEPIEGRTRLQKLVFLMQKRLEEAGEDPLQSDDYEFVPYDYGPFSKELYDDLDETIARGMVEDREEDLGEDKVKYDYEIQDQGKQWVGDQLSKEEAQRILELAEEIKDEYGDVYLSDLIDEVYSRYPKYAENSIY
ncbi:type II toxin-antitoxin system antitoxin SocA domain-containing protein [Natrinema versiforme]|uniref:DUF4065 domain-containing protein n=1 Tax=Natrinema versiforme TaxID=88724 RepID=A0A4P8WMR8_9EURY|nr:type II toxin-antitoxin system antitoxin SocA domain-containing protein [Natrinema versiforme]QCS43603.1 DUF4065 domain-containing protein [Natrinema versiforme]